MDLEPMLSDFSKPCTEELLNEINKHLLEIKTTDVSSIDKEKFVVIAIAAHLNIPDTRFYMIEKTKFESLQHSVLMSTKKTSSLDELLKDIKTENFLKIPEVFEENKTNTTLV